MGILVLKQVFLPLTSSREDILGNLGKHLGNVMWDKPVASERIDPTWWLYKFSGLQIETHELGSGGQDMLRMRNTRSWLLQEHLHPSPPSSTQLLPPVPSAHILQPLPTHLPSLTSSRSGRLRRRAPQQPRKPNRDRAMPTASSSHAPALSTALAATMSWKPAGSTATQIPMPARHVPPACSGRSGDDHGLRGCPRFDPLPGNGCHPPLIQMETSPHADGGCFNPLFPSLGLVSPTPEPAGVVAPQEQFPSTPSPHRAQVDSQTPAR